MRLGVYIFFIALLVPYLLSSQEYAELPFKEIPKSKIKNASAGIVLSKMMDSLGHRYYVATENLSDSLSILDKPKQLLDGILRISDILDISLTNQNTSLDSIGYSTYRSRTLNTIKNVSSALVQNDGSLNGMNWDGFIKYMTLAKLYCNELIAYRKAAGDSNMRMPDEPKRKMSQSKELESLIGADGITNQQWLTIMEAGGGPDTHDKIRKQGRVNNQVLAAIKKAEPKAEVKVGELEDIEMYTSTVEGITYNYFAEKPRQSSLLYSSDEELIKNLIDWAIYINAGKPAKLSEMLRLGLLTEASIQQYEHSIISGSNNTRSIIDKQGNSIRFSVRKRYYNKGLFWDVPIDEVHITKENNIQFIRNNPRQNPYGKKQVAIMTLENVDGSLLRKIKKHVLANKEGTFVLPPEDLGLKSY